MAGQIIGAPSWSRARSRRVAMLDRILTAAQRARGNNIRTRGVMASPPTVTDDGTSAPGTQTNSYLVSANPGLFQMTGAFVAAQTVIQTSRIAATGGNTGVGDGGYCSASRVRFLAEDTKVTLRLAGSARAYRVIVDGQYVDASGLVPGSSSGGRYFSYTFGTRAIREFIVETQLNQAFVGVYVSATGKVHRASDPLLRSVALGDSWMVGTAATHLADGLDLVCADHLGWDSHMQSGAASTGFVNTNSGYNFLDRVNNGDLGLGGTPDVILMRASLNDKNQSGAAVTANCLAALRSARAQYPNALLIQMGAYPVAGANGGTLSSTANEAAVKAAFDAAADPFSAYVPIINAIPAAPISGTGNPSATTGSGNADYLMAPGDGSHLSTTGAAVLGIWQANAIATAVEALRRSLAA